MNVFQHFEEIDKYIQITKENKAKSFKENIEIYGTNSNLIQGMGTGFAHIESNGIGGWSVYDSNGGFTQFIPDGNGGFYAY